MKPTAYDGTTTPGTQPRKYDNNGKGWYFRYDDANKMSYKWILSITCTWMGQYNNTIPRIAKKISKETEGTYYTLDTIATEYTKQAFVHASTIFHRMYY